MKFLRFPSLLLFLAVCSGQLLTAQPVIDAEGDLVVGSLTVEPSAILELVATNKGFLVPRMSQAQRDAIVSPAAALMIFNTTTSEFNFWDPSTASWEVFISSSNVMDYAWVLEGNNLDVAVDPALQSAYNGATGAFLGTTSADDAVIATVQPQDIEFWTAATQRAILDASGNFYPATDNSYTLGTDAMRWADAYVNGGSVHIGPSGGEAGNTEMNLGYAAGTGTIDVDGGADEIMITTATTTVTNNLDATAGLDVTGADLTVGGTNFVVDVATGAVDAPNGGHDFGTAGVDAQVMLIEGLPFTAPNYELIVDGDVQITGLLALPALTPNSVLYTDAGGNVSTDNPPFSYDEGTNTMTTENLVVTTLGDFQGTVENTTGNLTLDDATDVTGILDAQSTIVNTTAATPVTVDDDLLVNNTTTMVEEFDAQDFGNTVGDGTDQQQLVVEGDPGAIIGNTLAANPPEWDLVVIGDQVTTGLIKAGGSIWIDGSTPGNHQIVANDELNVGTLDPSDLTLSTNGTTAVTIDGTTQDVDIANNTNVGGMLNVVGATTLQSTLDVDGITNLNSNLNVFGPTDLNSTLNVDGAVTINNTINQTGGGQVSFSGNVDATSGLDVSGQDLTVASGVSVEAPGSGHTFGTLNTDAQVVEILGDNFNVGQYELLVDGDVQITGFLALPGLNPNSVVYVDGLGNLATDNPPFAYDDVTNTMTTGNLVVTGTSDLQGAVANSTGNLDLNDDVDVTGDVVPTADNTYTLGTDLTRWAEVYVNGASVHIGPSGGEAGNTEMSVGYAANEGTINVDGGAAEVEIDAAGGITRFDPDGDGTLNAFVRNDGVGINTGVGTDIRITQEGIERNGGAIETFAFSNTGGDLDVNVQGDLDVDVNLNVDGATTLNGAVDLGDAAIDAITLNGTLTGAGSGHSLGTAAVDANVLSVLGDPFNVGNYELFVDGDVQITGLLNLAGLANNAVVVTDASGNLITDAEFTYDATTDIVDIRGTIVNGTGDVTVNDNLDVNNDLNVAGNSILGDDPAVDQTTINGFTEINETVGTDGLEVNESGAGNAAMFNESNSGDGIEITESNVGDGIEIFESDLGEGLQISESNDGDGILIDESGVGNGATINAAGAGLGLEVNGGAIDGNDDGNELGNGGATTQLTIQGVQDATGAETLPNAAFDLAVNGDIGASGIVKSGAGVWLDGVSATHNVTADQPLNVNTLGANDLTLSTNSTTAVTIDGTTQNVNIANDADVDGNLNVDGSTVHVGTLDQQGSVSNSTGDVVVNDDLNVTGSADIDTDLNVDGSTVHVGTLNQQGAVSNSTGDVVVNDDLNVTGSADIDTDLNVDGSTVHVGTLNQQGAVSNSTGDVVVNDDLNVTGSADIDTDLNVDGSTVHVGTLNQQGSVSNSTGDVVVNDDLNVTGSLDVDTDLNIDGTSTLVGNVDAQNGLDVTGADLTVSGGATLDVTTTIHNGAFGGSGVVINDHLVVEENSVATFRGDVNLGNASTDAISLVGTLTGAGSGHSLGTLATDANVLTINGLANTSPAYELVVNGDAQITGNLALASQTPNAVLFIDAAGNMATETTAGDFYWDETNNRLGIGNGGLAPTQALDVTGNIEATGTVQSGTSIIMDGTTPGSHNIRTTGVENLTLDPAGSTLFVNATVLNHGPGILTVDPATLSYLGAFFTLNPGATSMSFAGGMFAVNPGSLSYQGGLFNVSGAGLTYQGPLFNVNGASLSYAGGNFTVSGAGNTDVGGTLNVDGASTLVGAVDAQAPGNIIGDGLNAEQLEIQGVDGGAVELDVNGDADVSGTLTAGTLNLGLTQGSVPFADALGALTEDNTNLFWDDANNRLGIGNNAPTVALDVTGDIEATGTIQSGASIIIDGTTPGAHNITTSGAEDLTIAPGGGDLAITGNANVTGSADVDTDLNVDGTLDVAGLSTFTGAIDAQGIIQNSLPGPVTVQDQLAVNNGLVVIGGINASNSGITNAGAISGATTITASGLITGGSFSGDGALLTNLNASNLATGDVPLARMTTNVIGAVNASAGTINAVRIGVGLTDAQVNDNLTINGGAINATPIGATTPSTGAFTTISTTALPAASTATDVVVSNAGVLQTRTAASLSGLVGVSTDATLTGDGTTGTPLGFDLANANSWTGAQTFSSVDVNGGTIDGTAIGGAAPSTGAFTSATITGLAGGGNQSLYVDNTGAVAASNATAAQNATGLFSGSVTIAAPNVGGTEAIVNANVTATSIIVYSRVSAGGPQLSSHITVQTAGVGFTVQFSGPVAIGDVINYTIINP